MALHNFVNIGVATESIRRICCCGDIPNCRWLLANLASLQHSWCQQHSQGLLTVAYPSGFVFMIEESYSGALQVQSIIARHQPAFAAAGANLSLQRAQQSYWLQIDVTPGPVVGHPGAAPMQFSVF
jgi:hypothetical protein